MKELFDQFKSVTDIFNVGRLVFYPIAGALSVLPLYLLIRMVLVDPAPTLYAQLAGDLTSITSIPYGGWVGYFVSTAAGFLIAVVGFRVLERASSEIGQDTAAQLPDRAASYNYNYPLLRQKKDEDYAAWLISEYFRYVEIATYIPMGALTGLILLTLYVFVFVVRQFGADGPVTLTSTHILLVTLVAAVTYARIYFWPEVWVRNVIMPTQRTFLKAKCNLIEGVKAVEREVGPFKAEDDARRAPIPAK